ncbi:MAG: hypothetical protein KatS3mg132_849 [Limisphaera sp.]|nr:MAG: hypothetical protein KatS3mg132_849 [Limisphaera sp.]
MASSRLRRWWPLLRPTWPYLIGGLLAGMGFAALSGVGLPVMLKTVLPIFFGREEEASPWVVRTARSLFGEQYQDRLLLLACLGMPGVFLLRGLCSFLNRYWINRAGFVFLGESAPGRVRKVADPAAGVLSAAPDRGPDESLWCMMPRTASVADLCW